MSDAASSPTIDTKQIIQNLDYDELFEGTALEGVDTEDDDIVAAIGRRIGEIFGRQLGETIGGYLGALMVGNLLQDSASDDEGDEASGAEDGEDGEQSTDGDSSDQSEESDSSEDGGE